MVEVIMAVTLVIIFLLILRDGIIKSFKVGYYEQKLRNKDIDISNMENAKLLDIIKFLAT